MDLMLVCRDCGKKFVVSVDENEWNTYKAGCFAPPNLTPEHRIILFTGSCGCELTKCDEENIQGVHTNCTVYRKACRKIRAVLKKLKKQ